MRWKGSGVMRCVWNSTLSENYSNDSRWSQVFFNHQSYNHYYHVIIKIFFFCFLLSFCFFPISFCLNVSTYSSMIEPGEIQRCWFNSNHVHQTLHINLFIIYNFYWIIIHVLQGCTYQFQIETFLVAMGPYLKLINLSTICTSIWL